jgi:importin-5
MMAACAGQAMCEKLVLDALVKMCLKGLQDPMPRVRWSACQALGQLCSDLGPTLQEEQHACVMPALLQSMGETQSFRVQVGIRVLHKYCA